MQWCEQKIGLIGHKIWANFPPSIDTKRLEKGQFGHPKAQFQPQNYCSPIVSK